MPANLTPAYKTAEAHYKRARDPQDRLDALKEMLRAIPKHKGTEHLQGDIKAKIKELSDELAGPKKGGARTGPATVVKPDGAGQIALLGPPNSGKSSIQTSPSWGRSMAVTRSTTVVFPAPDGPMMAEIVPAGKASEASRRIQLPP